VLLWYSFAAYRIMRFSDLSTSVFFRSIYTGIKALKCWLAVSHTCWHLHDVVHSSEWLTTCWLTLSYIPFFVTPDCVFFFFSNINTLNITPRLVVWMKFCLWTIKRPNPLYTAAHTVCDVIFLHWNTHTKAVGLHCEWHRQHSWYAVMSQYITDWFQHLPHVQ
jgi:hypothetical protein